MKVRDLYETVDGWTTINVVDLNDKKVYEGLMMGLEYGIKEEGCENIFFDEKLEDILNRRVIEFRPTGEDELKIVVL